VRRLLVMLMASAMTASASNGPVVNVKPAAISGHVIGETIGSFLRREPEARQKADECRQHPDQTSCAPFLAALDYGQRAEISMSGHVGFILDKGKLSGLTMPVGGGRHAAIAGLTKKFGAQPRKTAIASQNIAGAKWEDYLLVWKTRYFSVALYVDNDPALHDRRPLLMVESIRHDQEYTVSVKQLREGDHAE
jgi:hypothetical protein